MDATRLEQVQAAVDARLSDVWISVFQADVVPQEFMGCLAALLRMAYVHGYDDALTEKPRGSLFKQLGVKVTPRASNQKPG